MLHSLDRSKQMEAHENKYNIVQLTYHRKHKRTIDSPSENLENSLSAAFPE